MAFERKSMESLVSDMESWARGTSTKLTDFRVGSKIRTLFEAVAVLLEQQYDRMFRALKSLIETNIYAIIGFDKVPATYATGIVTFSRSLPADQNYLIQAGTALMTQATQYDAPLKFYTTEDAVIQTGATQVDVTVICEKSGTVGRISSGAIKTFVQKPIGIDSVTNGNAFTTGAEEETAVEQKARFQNFIEAQARGVLQAIAYGAKLAKLTDTTTGIITESIKQAEASEDLELHKGEVNLYLWNGVGEVSGAMKAEVLKILTGYYDASGNPVYGYKPAGILVNIYSVPMKYVTIKLIITPEAWSSLEDLKPIVEDEVDRYFRDVTLGATLVQSALEANIKFIDGVNDVKLYLSTDSGDTWTMDNISADDYGMLIMQGSIVYA